MSFILDALKKSENERQDSAPAEFTTVSSNGASPAMPRWLWVLGALLAINALVLAFLLLRPDAGPASRPVAAASPATIETAEPAAVPTAASRSATTVRPGPVGTSEPDATDASFSARVAEARRDRPAREPAAMPQTVAVDDAPPVASSPRAVPPASSPIQTLLLPTLTELRTNGTLNLPDMHLDIHVYSENPEDRFVFINMSKYRERSNTKEGPQVSEITADGVVLDYQGRTFLLPRD